MKELGYVDVNSSIDITDYVDNTLYEEALKTLTEENPNNEYYKSLEAYHEKAVYNDSKKNSCCD